LRVHAILAERYCRSPPRYIRQREADGALVVLRQRAQLILGDVFVEIVEWLVADQLGGKPLNPEGESELDYALRRHLHGASPYFRFRLDFLFDRLQEWTKSTNLCQHGSDERKSTPGGSTMDKALYDRGMTMRRKVLGDEYVDRAVANTDDFNRQFQELLTTYCWGAVWGDDALKPRERSILNLGMIACLGRMHEFEAHFRGALRNGLTPNELSAILRQIAVYCGFPAAVDCHRVAKQVLAAEAKKA
jgi:4-carboxymuconolactone decarboxylase